MKFDRNDYYTFLINGDLPGAIAYLKQFSDKEDLYKSFINRFERGQFDTFEDDPVNNILTAYQSYYRDVFFLRMDKRQAEAALGNRLTEILEIREPLSLELLERDKLVNVFSDKHLHFMVGRTDGYYGPYVWKSTEITTYEVELPDGIETYTVKLLDGFISKSWLDYISFGELGTGGWTDSEGVICCIRQGYDFDSEDFRVSLFKHEAQHARDIRQNGAMSSEDLEYRAKLVELIYSTERNLLPRFIREAESANAESSGHSSASRRLLERLNRKLDPWHGKIEELSVCQLQAVAKELFRESQFDFVFPVKSMNN